MSRRAASLFLALAAPAFGLLTLALPMDANWDLRNYHYYNAYAFLTGRAGYDFLVAQVPTFFNPLLDAPFFLAAEAWPARVVGFLLGTVQGLNVVPLYGIAQAALQIEKSALRRLAAAVLALLGMVGVGALSELGTTFYDNVVSLGPLTALWLILRRREALSALSLRAAMPTLLAAGLAAGIATGLKQPIVTLGAGAGLALIAIPASWARRLTLVAVFGSGAILGVAASAGFWMLHLWRAYGNPLFPFYNQIFHSPWALPTDYRDVFYIPGLWARLFFPVAYLLDPSLTAETGFRDLRILACFFLIPLVAVVALVRRRAPTEPTIGDPVATRYLFTAFAIGYAAWVLMFCIYRYLVAYEMLAPLVIVLAIGALPLGRRARALAIVGMLLLIVATMQTADWGRVPWSGKWVEAAPPKLADPARTVVLITGHEPLSFLVPFFPPAVRFLRVHGSFTGPYEPGVRFNTEMHRIVAEHRGPLFILYNPNETVFADKYLPAYGLAIDRTACQLVLSNIGYLPYLFCALRPQ